MASPAQRHLMRVSAAVAAHREDLPMRHANAYERQLHKMGADRAKLKQIHSVESKAEHKRAMLPEYAPWVAGVLEAKSGKQDDVLMTVMQWRLDVGDIAGALDIARYAIPHKLTVPNNARPVGYLFAEDVALCAMRANQFGEPVSIEYLLETLELTASEDMPDQVRAKLHKVIGYTLRDNEQLEPALNHLLRAMQLDKNAHVKKDIERLESALKPKPIKAPAKAKATTDKRKSPAKPVRRPRGRPRKQS
ncbi:phage terminase small subunit [Hafnia paralvei]|uniref:phage terminase small subunit n=1 Tax=Hafnia paralvei TaxID=546367 RepID=UPI001FFF2728|nr:phage terminase small subunit [Hafnia paralvei]MCK2181252.1 phage terminase small subunit [Hafnia paralvei]